MPVKKATKSKSRIQIKLKKPDHDNATETRHIMAPDGTETPNVERDTEVKPSAQDESGKPKKAGTHRAPTEPPTDTEREASTNAKTKAAAVEAPPAVECKCHKCGKKANQFKEGGVEGYLRNVRPNNPRGLWVCHPDCKGK